MRDVKTRAAMEQPKTRQKDAIPRTAVRILQRHYVQQKQERQTQHQRQPVEYATEQVKQSAVDAARLTLRATRQLQRKYALHKYRAQKARQRLEQMAQAAGKTIRAGIEAIAAAGGGALLFLLLALPVIAVAAALSPAGVVADSHTMEPTSEAMEVWERLPDDLSMERRMVVTYALALVEKVDYFWGGKSLVLGWDDRWGELTEVTAEGSDSTGTEQPYGLDCSGFVDWAFYNASGGRYIIGQGGGAAEQHGNCVDIEWDEVQPGDLLFYPEDEHVGIAAGRDWLGRLLVVHCASGTGGVAISHRTGFETVARPVWYEKES